MSLAKVTKPAGPIESVLRSLTGGKSNFMEMARLAPQIDPALAPVIEEWDRLKPKARNNLDLDDLCKLKDIDPSHFLGVVAEAAQKFHANASILIAAVNMPAVVGKSVRVAMTDKGVQDRKFLFEHSSFIPMPQGARVSILNQNALRAEINNEQPEKGLTSFEKRMEMADVIDED
jgi:hypothetical protein